MEYLRDEQYYIDLYDLFTIRECLRTVRMWKEAIDKKCTGKELKKVTPEELEKGLNYVYGWQLRGTMGERYRRRTETIQQWMARDKTKQDKLDDTLPPNNVFCPHCNVEMFAGEFKELEDFDDDKSLRVFFFFECPKCKKRKGVFDNGEERVFKPNLCPKCGKKTKVIYIEKDEVMRITTKCTSCKYKNVDVYDWAKQKLEREAKEKEDNELLEKYRKEFCLSEKDGQEYIELIEAMEVANAVQEEERQKYDNPVYQRSLQLKKTTIVELEKLLNGVLEQAKYIKLTFDKPEIGQYVNVPFTVSDSDSSRKERVSISELERLIKEALKDTNWRLLSNSTIYRLGYLQGQLKGYEGEEEMLKLTGRKEETDPKPRIKIDDAKMQKYSSNGLVQLARIMGKQEGIENARKRRLDKEPDGFFLDSTEGQYNCGICSESHYGNEIWWNLDGLRCTDCRRNIKEGVIPRLKNKYKGEEDWFQNWEIKYNYGVHPSSVRKLRREGLLHGRDLLRKDGTIYHTVYLVSENQEFLNKYPKIDSKIKMTFSDKDGKQIEL